MELHRFSLLIIVSYFISHSLGCAVSGNTVYWAKSGATRTELERDKEECQNLQRSVGVDDWNIHKCLEVKGWTQIDGRP